MGMGMNRPSSVVVMRWVDSYNLLMAEDAMAHSVSAVVDGLEVCVI